MRTIDDETGDCKVRVHPGVATDMREMVMRCVHPLVTDINRVNNFLKGSFGLCSKSCLSASRISSALHHEIDKVQQISVTVNNIDRLTLICAVYLY